MAATNPRSRGRGPGFAAVAPPSLPVGRWCGESRRQPRSPLIGRGQKVYLEDEREG